MPLTTIFLAALAALTLQTPGHAAADGHDHRRSDHGRPRHRAALSPDGARSLFVRTTTDGETGGRNADIWAVPADGSAPPQASHRRRVGEHDAGFSARRHAPRVRLRRAPARRRSSSRAPTAAVEQAGHDVSRLGVQTPLVFSPTARASRSCRTSFPMRRRSLQRARAEESGEESGQGAQVTRLLYRHWSEWRENCAITCSSAICRAARPSTSRPAISTRRRSSTKTARHRVLARRQAARLCLESRRQRRRGVDDEPGRVDRAGRRRRAARS